MIRCVVPIFLKRVSLESVKTGNSHYLTFVPFPMEVTNREPGLPVLNSFPGSLSVFFPSPEAREKAKNSRRAAHERLRLMPKHG